MPAAPTRPSEQVRAVLDGLDPEQREVAERLAGPLCVLAGAGTGKTRAITHRIAHGVLSGAWERQQVLAVTFTVKAAGEMRSRLHDLGVPGVQARTFHSAALSQARYFWPKAVGGELPRLVDSKIPLVREAAARCRIAGEPTILRDLTAEVEWAKVSNVSPEGYAAAAPRAHREVAGVSAELVARLYGAYEQIKTERTVIDMEDVLLSAVGLLSEHAGIAQQVQSQYRHLVVDEYQDVSPLQQRLLDLWVGDRRELCVVGDANQTIYSFAGARPDYLLGFTDRFPDAAVVKLVRNYRSTPEVVHAANSVLSLAKGVAARHRIVLRAERPTGPAPVFTGHPDEPAEAAEVARRIRRLVDSGHPVSQVALLFRINAQSEVYEQALTDAKVPYVLKGGVRFFDRPEVRQAVVLLKGAAKGTPTGEGLVSDVRGVLAGLRWSPQPPEGRGATRERWESLAAVDALAAEVAAANPGAALADLSAELDARAVAQHAPTVQGVTVASLHSAKGLEWDAVFLVGAQEGTLPILYAETPEEIEEERRLFYVGVTRARSVLEVSWARSRNPGGSGHRKPSRFLDGLLAADEVQPPGKARKSAKVARCRVCGAPLLDAAGVKLGRCTSCPSTMDDALFERLKQWRLERSKADSVPAFVVFSDATLVAIAEARPTDERSLLLVSGIGSSKLERYGADVLALCAD